MEALDTRSALLLRLLTSFFGVDRVLYGMSLLSVCGGEESKIAEQDLGFARSRKCLFTIVDDSDSPKLVVEMLPGRDAIIDIDYSHARQILVERSLENAGVRYVTMSVEELECVLDPASAVDFCALLSGKVLSS